MSSVQIRELPQIISASQELTLGSWFPTGYYGHNRAKSRIDLCNYYRQQARPCPPRTFLKRQNSEATTHQFSQHDNRSKFESDPFIRASEAGFGRRRSATNGRGEFNPLFLSWTPNKIPRQHSLNERTKHTHTDVSDENIVSSRPDTPSLKEPSCIIQLPPSSSMSLYTSDYNHGQPDHQQAKQIRQETFQRFSSTRTRRLLSQRDERSTSVAACLIWPKSGNVTKADGAIIDIIVPITTPSHIDSDLPQKSNQSHLYHSQSTPNFTKIQPSKHVDVVPTVPRPTISLEPLRVNKMDNLVSKYM